MPIVPELLNSVSAAGIKIHADFGDYEDDNYYLDYKCDKCGSTEEDE